MEKKAQPYIAPVLITAILTKQKLFKRYHFLPYEEAKNRLNEIICNNRGLDCRTGSLKRILLVSEVERFLKEYDLLFTIEITQH